MTVPLHPPTGRTARRWPRLQAALVALILLAGIVRADTPSWVGLWATAPLEEAPTPQLLAEKGMVLRQVVRISTEGQTVRLRFSNEYGAEPLDLADIRLAVAGAGGSIQVETDRPVRFGGALSVRIPPKAVVYSDPVAFCAPAHADLAITVRLAGVPAKVAGHPGSRATSYLKPGVDTADPQLPGAVKIVHWYFLCGVEAETRAVERAAIVCLGDSITDGHGCEPDQNTRWTDAFSRRLMANPATAQLSVLNLGIGGGRLLRQGLGPSGLERLSRDVFEQAGVRWVIVQLGVNDLGTRIKARAAGQPFASAKDLINGYQRVISDCHAHGVRVALATITPFAGAGWYSTPDIEADRQTVNQWIRVSAPADRIIDFDGALRDPANPTLLLAAYDSGDHLHPSIEGYRHMAESVPLDLFAPAPGRAR